MSPSVHLVAARSVETRQAVRERRGEGKGRGEGEGEGEGKGRGGGGGGGGGGEGKGSAVSMRMRMQHVGGCSLTAAPDPNSILADLFTTCSSISPSDGRR